MSKSAPSSATAGVPFEYTIVVSDAGPAPVPSHGTTVTDQLPQNGTLYGATPSQGSCSMSGSPATVTCQLGTVSSGASATVILVVAIGKPGAVTNTATASNDDGSSASGSATTAINAAPATGTKPRATTGASRTVGKHRVRVFGRADSGPQPTVCFFQYGRTRAYGSITKLRRTSRARLNVKELLRRLTRGVRYHYRLVAINDSGISYGRDRTFRIRAHKRKHHRHKKKKKK
jgi:uncharacterized repeat protein (TIGR01451 family)